MTRARPGSAAACQVAARPRRPPKGVTSRCFLGSQTLSTVFVTAGHPTRTVDIKDNDDEDMHAPRR